MNSVRHIRHRLRSHVATNLCIVALLSLFCLSGTALAQETDRIPSFAELEAEGAVIGEIRIDNQNIFDLENPEELDQYEALVLELHRRLGGKEGIHFSTGMTSVAGFRAIYISFLVVFGVLGLGAAYGISRKGLDFIRSVYAQAPELLAGGHSKQGHAIGPRLCLADLHRSIIFGHYECLALQTSAGTAT